MRAEQKGVIDWLSNTVDVRPARISALHDGKMFQRLSATRDRCQSSAFVLSFHYFVPASEALGVQFSSGHPILLGFVLPKRLVKRAVDRNQIKRWARAFLRTQTIGQACAVVIKAKTRVFFGADDVRTGAREELLGLVQVWGSRARQAVKPGQT